jgi:hypothetical protein
MGNGMGKSAGRETGAGMRDMGYILANALNVNVDKGIEFAKVFCLPRVDKLTGAVNHVGVEAVREVDKKINELFKNGTLLKFYDQMSEKIRLSFGDITDNILEHAIAIAQSHEEIPDLISNIFRQTINCTAETVKAETIEVINHSLSKLIDEGSPAAEELVVRLLEKNEEIFENLIDKGGDKLDTVLKITLERSELLMGRVIEKTIEKGGEKLEKVLLKVMADNIHLIGKVYGKWMKTTVDVVDNKVSKQIKSLQKWFERLASRALRECSKEAKEIILFSLKNCRKEVNQAFDDALCSIDPYFSRHLQEIGDWILINGNETLDKLSRELQQYITEERKNTVTQVREEFSKKELETLRRLNHLFKSYTNEIELGGPFKNVIKKTSSTEKEKECKFINKISEELFELFILGSDNRLNESHDEIVDDIFEEEDEFFNEMPTVRSFDSKNVYFLKSERKALNNIFNKTLSQGFNLPDLASLEINQSEEQLIRLIANRIYIRLIHNPSPIALEEHTELGKDIPDKRSMKFCLFDGNEIPEESTAEINTTTLNKDVDQSSEVKKEILSVQNEENRNETEKKQSLFGKIKSGVNAGFNGVNDLLETAKNVKNATKILSDENFLKNTVNDTSEKIISNITGVDEIEKKIILNFKKRDDILKEIENKQSRVIIFYKPLKDGSKERLLKYSILNTEIKKTISVEEKNEYKKYVELRKKETKETLIKVEEELKTVILEELKEISLLISGKSENLTKLSIINENIDDSVKKVLPIYEVSFDYFYRSIEIVNAFLKKYKENAKLEDSETTLIQFAEKNKILTKFEEMLNSKTTEETNTWIKDRFGQVEQQSISTYATDLPDTIIEPIHIEIKSYKESTDENLMKKDTCVLLQNINKSFELKYHQQIASKIVKIKIEDVPGLGHWLGTTRYIEEIEEEKIKKAKGLISDYINNKYHYDDFFSAVDTAYHKGKFFNLCKIGTHLEKITDRENENHLLCTGKTFFRMKCYEKALLYFTLASEKYVDLLRQNPNSPYYDYQVTLMQFLVKKLEAREEKDIWVEKDLVNDENYPRTLNFRLKKGEFSLENLEKLTQINTLNLQGSDWLDQDLKLLIESLIEIKNIDILKNLTHINLSKCNQLTNLESLKKFENLRHLNIYGCKNLNIESVQELKSLNKIMFLAHPLSWRWNDTNIKHLYNFSNLTFLNINNDDQLSKDSIEALFTALTKIKHLGLNCKELGITNLISITPLKLKTLSLINAENLTSLEGLDTQEDLTSLNLSGFTDTQNELSQIIQKLGKLTKSQLNGILKL